MPAHVVDALHHGPQADQTLLGIEDTATLLHEGYPQTENGYGQLADGGGDGHYVGRTSLIEEYLGSAYAKAAIHFVAPDRMGLPEDRLGDSVAVLDGRAARRCPPRKSVDQHRGSPGCRSPASGPA